VTTRPPAPSGFRNEAFIKAFDAAVSGTRLPLFSLLARASGLPGVKTNDTVLAAFAEECAARGKSADALVVAMATLEADRAPGGTELEFIPMCGVAAATARALRDDAAYAAFLPLLHQAAEDLRYRVRDEVVRALSVLGAARGDRLVADVSPWMDGYFHAAAVLRGLGLPPWTTALKEPALVLERLEQALTLALEAPRAASRYPGHKALIEALAHTPGELAFRFGVPIFAWLREKASLKDPVLRETLLRSVARSRLLGRYAEEVNAVRAAFVATTPGPRDPRTYVGPTRGRGAKRKRD
jgi:hypothetical protein